MPDGATQPALDYEAGQQQWAQALTVARLLALNVQSGTMQHFKGVHLKAGAGPVRDAWLAAFAAMAGPHRPTVSISPDIAINRLIGGLDIAATLATGKTVIDAGLVAQADAGTLIISGADRLSRATAALLCPAIDDRKITVEIGNQKQIFPTSFSLIAVDERDPGDTDETASLAPAITSRLPVTVDLHAIAWHDICGGPLQAPDCTALPQVQWPTGTARTTTSDEALTLMAELARAMGTPCIRTELAMAEIASLLATEAGRGAVNADDVAEAAFITLGLRLDPQELEQPDQPEAETADAPEAQNAPPQQPPPRDNDNTDPDTDADDQALDFDDLQEMLIDAVKTGKIALPTIINKVNRATGTQADGKAGDLATGAKRGRPAGYTNRPPYQGARLNVIATLRAAAPWQKLRRNAAIDPTRTRAIVRTSDYRYIRYQKPTESTAIFAVDASGSTALDRLAEAKGAIEQLLAECYVRRDQVALVAFRGTRSEVLLEPTRSLVRAKRSLTGLPGGGPTPLADGLRAGIELAIKAKRRGQSPLLVMLTDGRGNIALDGTADRQRARDDAHSVARQAAGLGIRTIFIDIARRPRDQARELASVMKADYCALPRVDSNSVSAIVSSYLKPGGLR